MHTLSLRVNDITSTDTQYDAGDAFGQTLASDQLALLLPVAIISWNDGGVKRGDGVRYVQNAGCLLP